MSNKQDRKQGAKTSFEGVAVVKPKEGLEDKTLSRMMVHLGVGIGVSLDQFKRTTFKVLGVCPENGVRVTGIKNGKTANLWVPARFMQPA